MSQYNTVFVVLAAYSGDDWAPFIEGVAVREEDAVNLLNTKQKESAKIFDPTSMSYWIEEWSLPPDSKRIRAIEKVI